MAARMRTEYLGQLDRLNGHVARLGRAVVADIQASGQALAQDDLGAAQGVVDGHDSCVRLKRSVEDECLTLMLLQNPLASDLRFVTATFRSVSDLSRIDETAYEIALLKGEFDRADVHPDIPEYGELAENAATMVSTAMDAFCGVDDALAETVFPMDERVDRLYDLIKRRVVERLRQASDDDDLEFVPETLMIAKYYERMGDRAQRIADWAVFRATGRYRGRGIGGAE